MRRFIPVLMVVLLTAPAVQARPVSYPGGWTLMQYNDADTHSIHAHYSPTARYSIGYRGEYWRDDAWQFHGGQFNYLLKRWNTPASQANAYLKNGMGVAFNGTDTRLAAFTGLALDRETQRFFTSYENRLYEAGNIAGGFIQKSRIGVAPYIGNYGDLHTWFMLQVDHRPANRDPVTVTPLVRFFKGAYLMEARVSNQGHTLLNMIIRF